MKTSDFDYDLPEDLIAQTPVEPRDHSRLLVLSRADGSIQHRRFYDLPHFLRKGDVLVFNDSRVFPARLRGRRLDGAGATIELLLLSRLEGDAWRALVRPGRRL
ncbi:MAG: tRNA preQ1(34) S-adenosylmethionine ribosyltransferase-isomerase QueA, partial [SAR202 cluster bacterium]|nr:tRNA preQ1(34) S-adenosylmethionine ribosyltransferase-isomerase QueA [SAR202 cluster bacterium]